MLSLTFLSLKMSIKPEWKCFMCIMFSFEETVYLICTISFPHSLNKTLSIIPGISLTSLLSEKQKEFDDKFKKCFSLSDEVSNSQR